MEKSKIEILLIEDNLADAELMREMLAESRWEFSIDHVLYLADGLDLLKSRSFDVVMVDLGLPDSQGLETALTVRNQAKNAPVVVLTTLDDLDAALTSLQMDIQDYLVKGESNSEMVARSIRYAVERKRIAEALRESEERFRALIKASSEVLYRMSPDWSEMRQLYGQKFLASTESPSRTWLQKYIHPDDQPHVTAVIREAIRTRSVFELEHRVWRADDSLGWTFSRAVPLLDANGEIVEWFGAASDITERKQAEEALQRSEEKFSMIFNTAPVGITISTLADGRFVDINTAGERFSGYRRDEVIGHTSLEFDIWKDPQDRSRMVEEVLKKGEVRDREILMKDKGGNLFWASFSAVAVEIKGESYLLSLVSDITGRKRAEEEIERLNTDLAARAAELEAANRELEAFNYTVAHDLRNPLNVISSYCQVVQELCGERLNEECKHYIQETYDGTLRMNRLIGDLLNFSHLSHVEPRRETVDLSSLAQEVAAGLKLAEPARRVAVRIGEGITVNGDASLLRVVLDNLLGNAWKYTGMREEAVIEFGVTEFDGQPACFVRDNGEGFDQAYAEKLFVPFQRLPGTEKFRGFGIGLATVERIIRRHGGTIWAEGEPGKGATFWFMLQSRG